ncbi:HAUS augmin-like complex subunit 7 [Talpa occidentalis]|uniref:HAUS augmin-like complex subunit 7 n=1 Tax=Talpa occidentalis TaxID=50954 RepID=UPI00188ED0FD|nr:HAUS augmin-like complex subunit 7 [Talpa occidentalis]
MASSAGLAWSLCKRMAPQPVEMLFSTPASSSMPHAMPRTELLSLLRSDRPVNPGVGGARPGSRNMAGFGFACGAGGSEDEDDDGVSRAAVAVFAKLKGLNCPLMEGLHISEPKTIRELLCSPSKYRLEILEWLCARVCPSWQEQCSMQKGAPTEAKIQEMANLGHELLLCGPDDQELLRGRACPQKQLHFLDQLLDAVRSLGAGCTGGCSTREHFEDTREKNEALLGELFSCSYLQSLLSPECDPWPLDMRPLLEQRSEEWRRASPSVESEEEKVVELTKQLQESTTRLQALRAECFTPHQRGTATNGADTSTLDQQLRLVTSDFHQLVVAFLQVCEDELGDCCQRPGAYLHPCGPVVQAVHQTLASCSQLLRVVVAVTDTSAEAVAMAKQQQDEPICWSGSSSVMSLATKMDELAQRHKVFPGGPHTGAG